MGLAIIAGWGYVGTLKIVTFAEEHCADRPIYGIARGLLYSPALLR